MCIDNETRRGSLVALVEKPVDVHWHVSINTCDLAVAPFIDCVEHLGLVYGSLFACIRTRPLRPEKLTENRSSVLIL